MKITKIIFAAMVVLCAFISSRGQTEKGSFVVGGSSDLSFSFHKYSYDDGSEKDRNFGIYPEAGYFIADGLAVGTGLSLSFYKSGDYKTNSRFIGPFVKYYFGQSQFRPFLTGGTEFGRDMSSWEDEEFVSKSFMYKLGGGVAIFLTERISLDLGLRYTHSDYKSEDDEPSSDASENGVDLSVGFSFFL